MSFRKDRTASGMKIVFEAFLFMIYSSVPPFAGIGILCDFSMAGGSDPFFSGPYLDDQFFHIGILSIMSVAIVQNRINIFNNG